jgi:hypothetical protein
MCDRKPLLKGLVVTRSRTSKLGFSLTNTKGTMKMRYKDMRADSGSGAKFFKITLTDGGTAHHLVAKIQDTEDRRKIRGLRHEHNVYKFLNSLVDNKICPFFLRCYEVKVMSPSNHNTILENIVLTESFPDTDFTTMVLFMKNAKRSLPTRQSAVNFMFMLLYTIEVMYRVGIRHNDMHLNNIFIISCAAPITYSISYVRRDGERATHYLRDVRHIPLIFDNDRATKLSPQHNVTFHHAHDFYTTNHTPVTNLFYWHNPLHRTEKLDMYKLMHHLRDATSGRSSAMHDLVRDLCYFESGKRVCLTQDIKTRSELRKEFKSNAFDDYHIPLKKSRTGSIAKEVVPYWSGMSEKFLLKLADELPKERPKNKVIQLRMDKLYA